MVEELSDSGMVHAKLLLTELSNWNWAGKEEVMLLISSGCHMGLC